MQLIPNQLDLREAIRLKERKKIASIFPETGPYRRELYPKHMEFFADGSKFRIREFRAANRVGKTVAGAFETVCHLTGKYPSWWTGKKFDRPVNALVAGESGRLVRDSIQLELLGSPGSPGTGMIPFNDVLERRAKSGVPDAIDTVYVRHPLGKSVLQFQSYDQGREAFQATTRDIIWLDEEPALQVYTEALTRTMTTGGIVYLTFTPLKGVSETVLFMEEQAKEGRVSIITATWDDVPHLLPKDKEDMLASYPPHQRDARTKGIPALGAGAIYPIVENEFVIPPIPLPPHWRRGYALDVGWNKTAALFFAYDDDSDTLYLYAEHYRGQAEPSVHADAIRSRGAWLQGVIDPASRGRAQKDGEQLFQLYQEMGLTLHLANNSVEAGIYEVYQRLSSGRIKVFNNLVNFIYEYRLYRRDERGKIIKENDHLMDCLRYVVMSAIEVAQFPPEYAQKVWPKTTASHKTFYDPLSRTHVRETITGGNHKTIYDPFDRTNRKG